MKYKKIIAQLAKTHNTSKKEIDLQIRAALKNSGINIPPELVVEIAAEQVKRTIYNNSYNL